jgi:hypothetical protein
MKPVLIVAAAFCIAAATAFAMTTKAWADNPLWTSEDELYESLFGTHYYEFRPRNDSGLRSRNDSALRSQYGVPSQIMDYIREQYNDNSSNYITPHRSLSDKFYNQQSAP